MTATHYRFIWFDDSPDQISRSLKDAIEHPDVPEGHTAELTVHSLNNVNVAHELAAYIEQSPADLVILDHVLNKAAGAPILRRGSTVAAELREHSPNTPFIGVSGAESTDVSFLNAREYIDLFERDRLTAAIPSFFAIARDFRCLTPERIHPIEGCLELMGCPVDDREGLILAMPEELKEPPDKGTPHELARWIWKSLMGRPGFLYDQLHAAMLIGVTEDAFSKVAPLFDEAVYTGLFASSTRQRWWVSRLKKLLLKLVPEPRLAVPAKRGRSLPGIEAADYSRCHFTDQPFPDCVAAADSASCEFYPARCEITIIDPTDTPIVGFEPRRIIKRADS